MSFVTFAQNRDATAFKALVEESLAEKVVQVLEGLKAIVASSMFEEGGVSGGVGSVKKKPAPPAAGSVELPGSKEAKTKEGGLGHSGRGDDTGEKTGDFVLPGQRTVGEESELDEALTKRKARENENSYRRKNPNKFGHKMGKNGQFKEEVVDEGRTSGEPNPKGDRVKAVQKDKKPDLPTKKDFKKDGVDSPFNKKK